MILLNLLWGNMRDNDVALAMGTIAKISMETINSKFMTKFQNDSSLFSVHRLFFAERENMLVSLMVG